MLSLWPPGPTAVESGIGISILSTPRAIDFDSEDGLRAARRPGRDGVILTEGKRRGLFLPQVWDGLPDARSFRARLRQKAGLAPDHWSGAIRAFRFTAETFKGKVAVQPSGRQTRVDRRTAMPGRAPFTTTGRSILLEHLAHGVEPAFSSK